MGPCQHPFITTQLALVLVARFGFLFSSASHRLSDGLVSVPRFDGMTFPLFVVIAFAGTLSRAFHRSYVFLSSMLAALFMVMHSQWNWSRRK
jgi:hypothetical protein